MLNNLKLPDEALTEVVRSADKHLGETYDNLVQLPSKETGKGIASIVRLVFSPFRFFSDKAGMFFNNQLKVYEKELEEKIDSIPEEKRIEPDFHTVSVALDNSKFCITNDTLRKMFVNLIASTVNIDTKDIAHPAFAEIIKQMTSTDANLLKIFLINSDQPICQIEQKKEIGTETLFVNYFIPSGDDISCSVKQASLSITNLVRLGLVAINNLSRIVDEAVYNRMEEQCKIDFANVEDVVLCKNVVSLTPVGELFLKVCFDD